MNSESMLEMRSHQRSAADGCSGRHSNFSLGTRRPGMFHDPVYCFTSMRMQSAQLDFVDNNNAAAVANNNNNVIRNLERGKLGVLGGV